MIGHCRTRLMALAGLLSLTLLSAGCHSWAGVLIGVDEITPSRLSEVLKKEGAAVVVLDLRDRASFEGGHIRGATLVRQHQIPMMLMRASQGTTRIVVVCYHGQLSLSGAIVASDGGRRFAQSLHGGMQAWRKAGLPLERGMGRSFAAPPAKLPRTSATKVQQIALSVAAFGFKPAYMALSLLLILVLWRSRDKDLRYLRHAMVFFLMGETFCAGNYVIAANGSVLLEQLHGLGMVLMGMFFAWGLVELLDQRVLRFSDPKAACVLGRLCKRCWKRDPVACGLQQTFVWVAPTFALASLLPLCGALVVRHIEIDIFGSPVVWYRDFALAVVEQRVLPLLGASCFLLASWRLRSGQTGIARAKVPFFLGVGASSFALFRFLLVTGFARTPPWGDFWEEFTELLTILALTAFLFAFRRALGLNWTFWRAPSQAAESL